MGNDAKKPNLTPENKREQSGIWDSIKKMYKEKAGAYEIGRQPKFMSDEDAFKRGDEIKKRRGY